MFNYVKEPKRVRVGQFNSAVIEALRAEGKVVRIRHHRNRRLVWVDHSVGLKMQVWDLDPKGGKTIVEILNPDGTGTIGVSKCYHRDIYSKKIGVKLALDKALGLKAIALGEQSEAK